MARREREPALRYWEAVPVDEERLTGPCRAGAALLRRYLDALGERFPSFIAEAGASAGCLPLPFLHAFADGEAGRAHGYSAVVCVRWSQFECQKPLGADEPFVIRDVYPRKARRAVDRRYGLLELHRRILDEQGELRSTGQLGLLMLRIPRRAKAEK